MEQTELSQLAIFGLSIICGLIVAVIYDAFRLLRFLGLNKKNHILILDILNMLIYAIIIFIFSTAYNGGVVRLFIIAGSILGFIVYMVTIGLVTKRLFLFISKTYNVLMQIFKRIFGLFTTTVLKLDIILQTHIEKILKNFKNKEKKTCK